MLVADTVTRVLSGTLTLPVSLVACPPRTVMLIVTMVGRLAPVPALSMTRPKDREKGSSARCPQRSAGRYLPLLSGEMR